MLNYTENNFLYKIKNGLVTLSDQDVAVKLPITAYYFAVLNIPGTDKKKVQEAICKNHEFAYRLAMLNLPGYDVNQLCDSALGNINILT